MSHDECPHRLIRFKFRAKLVLHKCEAILCGAIAQLGERFAGSEEVIGSIPISSTTNSLCPVRLEA